MLAAFLITVMIYQKRIQRMERSGRRPRFRAARPGSAERLDERLVKPGEGVEELPALPLQPGHHGVVLVRPALPDVKLPRLQDLDVIYAGYRGRHLVAEIGIFGPLDGALDDALHDRGGVGNRYLLGTWVVITAADAPGVQHERLNLVVVEQLEHPVAHVGHIAREERVGARHAQELALLVLASGGRARRLAEHEIGRRLVTVEPGQ